MSIEKLIAVVNSISNDQDIDTLVKDFELTALALPEAKAQILGLYTGKIEGKSVTLSHRWYDRCRPFQIQPDGNKVALEIDGKKCAEGSFLDDH